MPCETSDNCNKCCMDTCGGGRTSYACYTACIQGCSAPTPPPNPNCDPNDPTIWTDLVEAHELIGDIDTYQETHYLLEDDDMHDLNATQGIRWIEPLLYKISYIYEE